MSAYLQSRFIHIIASRLQNFKQKKLAPPLFNFACPLPGCGDNHRDKKKARGYFFQKNNSYIYHCHNCGTTISFKNFLKDFDPTLYGEYCMELLNDIQPTWKPSKPQEITLKKISTHLPSVDELPKDHPATLYLRSRMIPVEKYNRVLFSDNFGSWVKRTFHGLYEELKDDSPRIVFPIYDAKKQLIAAQGRAIQSNGVRYRIVKRIEDTEKIVYGLNTVDLKKDVYLTEGPIDSLFLENSCAAMNADLTSTANYLSSLGAKKVICIPDNEPKNRWVLKEIKKMVDSKHTVVIWNEYIREKDVNDMILAGRDVLSEIQKSLYTGIQAQVRFGTWKKL